MKSLKLILYEYGIIKNDKIPLFWWNGMNNLNFGDILGPYLVKKISNKDIQYINANSYSKYYMTIGSIIKFCNHNSMIWGSGIISKNDKIKKPLNIYAVRGPKTRKRLKYLNINCPKIYGDPALLISIYYKSNFNNNYKIGIIPHYVDYYYILSTVNDPDIKVINILDPIEKVIDDICSCSQTLSSSLHGLIVSHAYEIPSYAVKFSNKLAGDNIKFEDYFLSVNVKPYKIKNYHVKDKTKKEIISDIQNHHQNINYDENDLLESCPFINK